ncbi:hypothetical protein ACFX14_014375 [Malus domestica]
MEEDDKSPQKLTGGHECNPTDIDSDEHFSNLNTTDTSVNEGTQLCASGDVWKAVNVPHSFYDSRNDA